MSLVYLFIFQHLVQFSPKGVLADEADDKRPVRLRKGFGRPFDIFGKVVHKCGFNLILERDRRLSAGAKQSKHADGERQQEPQWRHAAMPPESFPCAPAPIASRVGGQYIAAYTAAKHGVLGLTRALAVELLPYNITVNAICPGYVNTPMTNASVNNIAARTGMGESKAREILAKTSPQQRLMEPEEVAAIAVFLAQDIARGITGQAINIDGGGVMS